MPIISYQCKKCRKQQEREVLWIDPGNFASTPTMKSVFWCTTPYCENPIALRLSFRRGGVVTLVKQESTEGLYNPNKDEAIISARPRKRKGEHETH